jgi:hypothetical protein
MRRPRVDGGGKSRLQGGSERGQKQEEGLLLGATSSVVLYRSYFIGPPLRSSNCKREHAKELQKYLGPSRYSSTPCPSIYSTRKDTVGLLACKQYVSKFGHFLLQLFAVAQCLLLLRPLPPLLCSRSSLISVASLQRLSRSRLFCALTVTHFAEHIHRTVTVNTDVSLLLLLHVTFYSYSYMFCTHYLAMLVVFVSVFFLQ